MDRYAGLWMLTECKQMFVIKHNTRRTKRSFSTLLSDRDGAERDYSLKIRRLLHTSWESG